MDARPIDPDSAHGAESSTMIGGSRLSRRGLLGAGAIAALGVAGCGERASDRPPPGDAAVLGSLLGVELELVTAWSALAARGEHAELVGDLLARERAHARQLADAGARRNPAPPDVREAARAVPDGGLEAALALERTAAAAYLAALPELRAPDARELAFALHAAEAQHASVVLSALGRDPLPDAFAGTLS
jgi:Ferritin-like domain